MKEIYLEEVLKAKNPKLLKLLPGFVIRYLKRIIHQDEINSFIRAHGEETGLTFIRSVLDHFNLQVNAIGLENIPASGGCIIASNHPLGGLDGMALMDTVARRRPDLRFFVNDILMQIKNLHSHFVPVNKHGRNTFAMTENIEDVYASDMAVIIFPAGLVSRKQKGKIQDLEWKKSFISRAKLHNKPVVPTFIGGQNSNWFYNLSNFRKKVGVKANIEMLYLADEMYRQKNKTINIIFGKPVSPEVFKSRSDREWAQIMKKHIYDIGATQQPLEFKE